MDNLKSTFSTRVKKTSVTRENFQAPVFIRLDGRGANRIANKLLKEHPDASVLDFVADYIDAYCRRYYAKDYIKTSPKNKLEFQQHQLRKMGITNPSREGVLGYFPLNNVIIRFAPDQLHYAVRTSSNRGLISPDVQDKLQNFLEVGFIGLSVGYIHALTCSLEGLRGIRVMDFDVADPENFNRLPFPLIYQKQLKTRILQELFLINDPYSRIRVQDARLNSENVLQFLLKPKKLDLVFDEIDDPQAKQLIREYAKEYGIDVVSIADLGDGRSKGSYEAYSSDSSQSFYNGAQKKFGITDEYWRRLDETEIGRKLKIVFIVDPRYASKVLLNSLNLVLNEQLPSWPQDAGTIFGAAGAAPTIIKRLAAGLPINPEFVIDSSIELKPESQEERADAENIGNLIIQQALLQLKLL